MSFKDQLSKHENLLNKYKDLYLKDNSNSNNSSKTSNQNISISRTSNNSNLRQNPINDDSNITGNNIISNNTTSKYQETSNVLSNKFNNSDIQKSIEFNPMNKNQIGISNSPSFQNNKNVERSLEKIDVLLNKLNQQKNSSSIIKSNNNISKIENSKENDFDIKTDNKLKIIKNNDFNFNNQNNNVNYRLNTNNNFNVINNNKMTFQNIKEKYFTAEPNNFMGDTFGLNNNFLNTFQQQPKGNNFLDANDILNKLDNFVPNITEGNFFKNNIYNKNINLNNNNLNNNINIKIERLKAKYFSNDIDNFNLAIKQKDKEISILEKKLDLYKKKIELTQKNIIKIQSLKYNEEINNSNIISQNKKSKDINTTSQNITNILKESQISKNNNISNNNITNNNITNNGEETINFSLSEDESMTSGYFKFKTSQTQEDKEYNYNDVLPLINKVSKLKEIREIEENNDEEQTSIHKQSASEIVNNVVNKVTNNLINDDKNNEEDEKYTSIMNKFKEDGRNNMDLFGSQLKLSGIKQKNENLDEKPKIIRKNSGNRQQGGKKMISFEEFLSKEDNDE